MVHRGYKSKNVCQYVCPVRGCSKSFDIPKSADPPMNCDGHVSDEVRWESCGLAEEQDTVRAHFRNHHKDFSQSAWPPAFTILRFATKF